jgi:hypothetical protein
LSSTTSTVSVPGCRLAAAGALCSTLGTGRAGQVDALPQNPPQHLFHAHHDLPHVQGPHIHGLLTAEDQELPDKAAGAFGRLLDLRHLAVAGVAGVELRDLLRRDLLLPRGHEGDLPAGKLVQTPAEDLGEGRVDEHRMPFVVGDRQGVRGGFEDGPHPLLPFPQRGFHPLALGDVQGREGHPFGTSHWGPAGWS